MTRIIKMIYQKIIANSRFLFKDWLFGVKVYFETVLNIGRDNHE